MCATGLYTEHHGGSGYWHQRGMFGPVAEAMAELFVRELTIGIGETDIKAGVMATGQILCVRELAGHAPRKP